MFFQYKHLEPYVGPTLAHRPNFGQPCCYMFNHMMSINDKSNVCGYQLIYKMLPFSLLLLIDSDIYSLA